MSFPARFQLLTCLMLYVSCAQAIMVKFGTKMGPIEPPAPEVVLPPAQPYRVPAPVWEERINDTPQPYLQWRPEFFVPQPKYTQVVYNTPSHAPAPVSHLSSAQLFVKAYIPKKANQANDFFTPLQILGSRSLPGIGLRYFAPTVINSLAQNDNVRQEDIKNNDIETNNIDAEHNESQDDLQWKYEKDAIKLNTRSEGGQSHYVYQWPAYVPPRHQ